MKKIFSCALVAVFAIAASAQPCSDLFISEYVEGTNFNKAIEIYNPTLSAVSLTGYKLQLYTNGSSTVANTLNLTGTIAAGGVYIVAHSQAPSSAILAAADTAINGGAMNFNGNDAVTLLNGTTVIDQIGEIGVDPGNNVGWTVDTGSTYNNTLVRKSGVQEGTTNWTVGATEWDVLAIDTIRLGAHSMTPCAPPVDTIVRFQPISGSVNETAGTFNVNISVNQAPAADKTVDVTLISGDAADVGGFSTTNVLIPANSTSAILVVSLTNDALAEAAEQFQFAMRNPSGGLTLGADTIFTLTIADDDSIPPLPPFYSIGTVTTVDNDGIVDSLGVHCRVGGVVYGINLRNTGLQFTIHDGTGGINVISFNNNFGYTVQEGDSVVVSGIVEQFNGLAQMGTLDTIYEAGSGTLRQPTVVTELDETTESELVRINHVWLLDPSKWNTSNPAGFTVDVTNGTNTYKLRVEEQVDLFNQSAPTSSFDLIGLGSQFDSDSIPTSGYQIAPRSSDDLILRVGINDAVANNFVVYPNPNQGVFTIKLAEQVTKDAAITVKDIAGRNVFAAKSNLNESTVTVDVSTLSRGIYIVEIATATSVQRQKVSIQ